MTKFVWLLGVTLVILFGGTFALRSVKQVEVEHPPTVLASQEMVFADPPGEPFYAYQTDPRPVPTRRVTLVSVAANCLDSETHVRVEFRESLNPATEIKLSPQQLWQTNPSGMTWYLQASEPFRGRVSEAGKTYDVVLPISVYEIDFDILSVTASGVEDSGLAVESFPLLLDWEDLNCL